MLSDSIKNKKIKLLKSDKSKAIIYVIFASFWFSVLTMVVKHVSEEMHPFEIIFIRSIFCVLWLLPWAYKYGFKKLKPTRIKMYIFRAFLGISGMVIFFYVISSSLSLSYITSLTYLVPLITTVLATIFLKEKVTLYTWIGLFIGLTGTMMIIKPGFEPVTLLSITPVFLAFLWSVVNIVIKKLTETDAPNTIIFITTTMILPVSAILSMYVWKNPSIHDILFIILLSFASNKSYYYIGKAYSISDINTVLPFDFSRIVFISIFSFILFNEEIDIWSFIGSAIIIAGPLYINKKNKELKDNT